MVKQNANTRFPSQGVMGGLSQGGTPTHHLALLGGGGRKKKTMPDQKKNVKKKDNGAK